MQGGSNKAADNIVKLAPIPEADYNNLSVEIVDPAKPSQANE